MSGSDSSLIRKVITKEALHMKVYGCMQILNVTFFVTLEVPFGKAPASGKSYKSPLSSLLPSVMKTIKFYNSEITKTLIEFCFLSGKINTYSGQYLFAKFRVVSANCNYNIR